MARQTKAIVLAALGGLIAVAGLLYARRRQQLSLAPPGDAPAQPGGAPGPDPLVDALNPQPKERILQLRPGTDELTFAVAERLTDGKLDVFDAEQAPLDALAERAAQRGLENVVGWHGDPRDLLFEENRFDGAFLADALSDVSDLGAAMRELVRVVKPGGRVVVCAPDEATLESLTEQAEAAGLRLANRAGYVARFAVD